MKSLKRNCPKGTSPAHSALALSPEERDELVEKEQIIQRGLDTFLQVGQALAVIRQKRLYRAEFRTFEEYCRKKLDMSRIHAHRLVSAAEVSALLPIGNNLRTLNESHLRPLTAIPREKVAAVWEQALRTVGEDKITAKVVQEAVREVSSDHSHRETKTRKELLHWQELCLRRLRKLNDFVTDANADKAVLEVEAIKLILENVAIRDVTQ